MASFITLPVEIKIQILDAAIENDLLSAVRLCSVNKFFHSAGTAPHTEQVLRQQLEIHLDPGHHRWAHSIVQLIYRLDAFDDPEDVIPVATIHEVLLATQESTPFHSLNFETYFLALRVRDVIADPECSLLADKAIHDHGYSADPRHRYYRLLINFVGQGLDFRDAYNLDDSGVDLDATACEFLGISPEDEDACVPLLQARYYDEHFRHRDESWNERMYEVGFTKYTNWEVDFDFESEIESMPETIVLWVVFGRRRKRWRTYVDGLVEKFVLEREGDDRYCSYSGWRRRRSNSESANEGGEAEQ